MKDRNKIGTIHHPRDNYLRQMTSHTAHWARVQKQGAVIYSIRRGFRGKWSNPNE